MSRQKSSKGICVEVAVDSSIDLQCCGLLEEAAKSTLVKHAVQTANVCISIVDDVQIEKLNQQHLGHQGPTDVLTFDLSETAETAGEPGRAGSQCIDGEIVISRNTASREAQLRHHSVEAELALYVVHGVLHLLGYDDCDEVRSAAMHAMEDEILFSIGVGTVFARAPVSTDFDSHSRAAKHA